MKIAIGCDHGGLRVKASVKEHLSALGHEVIDFGTHEPASCDYPNYARQVCEQVTDGQADFGILVCGTGIGMSMAANKVRGVRAALAHDVFSAQMTRKHNDANVLCLGERVIGAGLALLIVEQFLATEFEGGRHQKRVDMMMSIESEQSGDE